MKSFLTLNKNISIAFASLLMLFFAHDAKANCDFHANFTYVASTSNCKSINFTNTSFVTNGSDSGVSYLWKLGSTAFATTKNASYTFSGNGTYTICLIMFKQVSGGICADTLCQYVTVNCTNGGCSFGTIGFELSRSCTSQYMYFHAINSDTSGTYKYTWGFGDQQYDTLNHSNVYHYYPNTGTYTVCLNIKKYSSNTSTACADTTICKTITVAAPMRPVYFSSSPSSSNCKTIVFTIVDTNTCAAYRWYWGDGSTSITTSKSSPSTHTYASNGTYTVCVRAMSCTDTSCYTSKCNTVTVNCNNGCNFGLNSYFSIGDSCHTLFGYVGPFNSCYKYTWKVNNTVVSHDRMGWKYAITANGTYNICVTILDTCSNCDTTLCGTRTITCFNNTNCNFSYLAWGWNYNCSTRTVSISGYNSDSAGTYKYLWSFGDQSYDTLNHKSTSHFYANNGTYTVCLYVKKYQNGVLCKDTAICKSVVVTGCSNTCSLYGYWGYNVHCPSREVSFSGYAADTSGTYLYLWNFGDSSTAGTAKSLGHTYLHNGTYTVCLKIKRLVPGSTTVCRDTTICKTITVNCNTSCNLHAYFKPTIICATKKVEVDNLTYGDSCYTSKWSWGDGTYSNDRTPSSHAYANAGKYTICLYVQKCGDSTCISTICKTVEIPASCCNSHAYFGASINCANRKVEVINYSYGDSCMIYSWFWGDNTSSSVKNPGYHVYNAAGTYTLCLKVRKCNDSSCYSYFCKTIVIPATCCPTPNFHSYNFCSTYRFINTTSGGTSFWWSFGDSSYSSAKSPIHTFPGRGAYTVCLTVYDSARHCSTKVCKTVVVHCNWHGNNHFEVPLSDDNIGDVAKMEQENTDLTPSKGLQMNIKAGISAYPNPTNNILNIVLPASSATLKITDITGAVLMQIDNVSSFYRADVSSFAAGIYFVNVTNENGTQSVRFMKN